MSPLPAPDHLSPTGWNLWENCNRQWAAKYLEGIVSPGGPEAEIGSFVHDVYEAFYDGPPENRTIGQARVLAGDLWADGRVYQSITSGQIDELSFKQAAWNKIEGLLRLEDPTIVKVRAIEHEAEWTERGVKFFVKIDRVDDGPDALGRPGLIPNEYKTGKVPKKANSEPTRRQVVIEAMGIAATLGAPSDTGYILYTGAGKVTPVETSLKARTAVAEQAASVWDEIRSWVDSGASWDEYEPNVQSLCGWCPVADRCPEGREAVGKTLNTWMTPERGIGGRLVALADGLIEEEEL